MLSKNKFAKPSDIFTIPFIGGSLPWKEFSCQYPEILLAMNGETVTDYLLFYYDKSAVSGIYTFKDEDAEHDIAEILGFDINIIQNGESEIEHFMRQQKKELEEYIRSKPEEMVDENWDALPSINDTKNAKKQRRLEKIKLRND